MLLSSPRVSDMTHERARPPTDERERQSPSVRHDLEDEGLDLLEDRRVDEDLHKDEKGDPADGDPKDHALEQTLLFFLRQIVVHRPGHARRHGARSVTGARHGGDARFE